MQSEDIENAVIQDFGPSAALSIFQISQEVICTVKDRGGTCHMTYLALDD